jgi:hypothetical protein
VATEPHRCGVCNTMVRSYGKRIPIMTTAEIITTAREIVTGEQMVVDFNDRDWQASLSLLLSGWREPAVNLGCVLVPKGPHLKGYWLNGRVPGVTLSAKLVAVEDIPRLEVHLERMYAALHPEEKP